MKRLFLLILLISAFGCSKRDPFPEKRDALYLEMVSEMQLAERNIVDAQKKLAEHLKEAEKVVPQTGQIHFSRKRITEATKAVELFKQQHKYWVVRTESRRNHVRSLFAANPDTAKEITAKEYQAFQSEKKLRQQRMQWDVKQRLENSKRSLESSRTPASDH